MENVYEKRESLKELQGRRSAVLMSLISAATGANALSRDDSTLTTITATLEANPRQNRDGVTSLWAPEAAEPSVSLVGNSF